MSQIQQHAEYLDAYLEPAVCLVDLILLETMHVGHSQNPLNLEDLLDLFGCGLQIR